MNNSDKKPVVSIIGTIYNQAKMAERSLDIWCRQNFDLPYEIIVLDDGSTDNTREMVTQKKLQYPGLIRYFYFDEPHLTRNCTLLFNTAIKRLMRSEIAVIQWYDRIPSTFDSLRILYEPHLKEDKISVSFLTRHIASSSSNETIDEDELERLLKSVDWRANPMELDKIAGTPGSHCFRHTMNESACFSVKKKHIEAINGYDERYVRVANYSNIELYGRLLRSGIRMFVTDDYTYHQPHPSNRTNMQTYIEDESVITRNTTIRQQWGSILPEEMVAGDECALSFIVKTAETLDSLKPALEKMDAETIVDTNWNSAMQKARGKIVFTVSENAPVVNTEVIKQMIDILKENPDTGCVGSCGACLVFDSKKGKSVHFKDFIVDLAMGELFAFTRKKALANGVFFADIDDEQLRLADFSRQMMIWSGKHNISLTSQPIALPHDWSDFDRRWQYSYGENNIAVKSLELTYEDLTPKATVQKQVRVLARYLSGNYQSVNKLLLEEMISKGWLYIWHMEHQAKCCMHFKDRKNRAEGKARSRQNSLAVIPVIGQETVKSNSLLETFNDKNLMADTILSCKNSLYVNRVIVLTDVEKIKKAATAYGADVIFLKEKDTSLMENKKYLLRYVATWLETVEDYWYDFIFCLLPFYPLRTEKDLDKAFERMRDFGYKELSSISEIKPYFVEFYNLTQDNRLTDSDVKRLKSKTPYKESSFLSIISRGPNYHIPEESYETLVCPIQKDLAYTIMAQKAITPANLGGNMQLFSLLSSPDALEKYEAVDIKNYLHDSVKPAATGSDSSYDDVLAVIRLDQVQREYNLSGKPLLCILLLKLLNASIFKYVILMGDCEHIDLLAKWANLPFIKGKKIYRLDGYPSERYMQTAEQMLNTVFKYVYVVNGRAPMLNDTDIINQFDVFMGSGEQPTISVSIPEVHPADFCYLDSERFVKANTKTKAGSTANISEQVYVKDRVLRITDRELIKGGHIRPEYGYFINKGHTVIVETDLDFIKIALMAWQKVIVSG